MLSAAIFFGYGVATLGCQPAQYCKEIAGLGSLPVPLTDSSINK
jgi:hypothetical protein